MKKTFSGHEDREPDGGGESLGRFPGSGEEIVPRDPHFTGTSADRVP
jgi:hypothetical protein